MAHRLIQAHAMLTHLGGGAGQGVEDAMVLARLLSAPGTNKHNIKVRIAHRNEFVIINSVTDSVP